MPELTHWQEFVLDAFHKLTRDRPVGLTIGPIPLASIDRYIVGQLYRDAIDDDEAEALALLVMRLDDHDRASKPPSDNDNEAGDGEGDAPRRTPADS